MGEEIRAGLTAAPLGKVLEARKTREMILPRPEPLPINYSNTKKSW
jgi:hypothetical protein